MVEKIKRSFFYWIEQLEPKSRGYQATKAKQVLLQNGGGDNFNRANLVFLSRSIDISTTKTSYNVNSPAFYELKEVIYTIIFVKEESTTIKSVANAVGTR